jgi:hypothetical protein
MPPPLILTRFLYAKDEVELSLMMALLKNEDLRMIYYWAYELYYSGFAIFDILLQIYLDYYYEKQPYLLSYIRKKQQLWIADGDMKHVAYVVRNMYNLQTSNTVFMVRQYMFNPGGCGGGEKFDYQAGAGSVCATMYDANKVCATMYDANKVCATMYDADTVMYDAEAFGPTILYKMEGGGTYRHYFLRAVARRHMENVWYYLKLLLEKGEAEAVEAVEEALGIELDKHMLQEKNKMVHYIIACIVAAAADVDVDVTVKKYIFVIPKQEHLDHILVLEEEKITPVYDTLMHKRFVAIDKDIGLFVLARDRCADLKKEIWFHWEYYAMGTPLWQKRLAKWGGTVNHTTKKLEFPTDEMQEAFYELYGYEFDELPKEVQAMSL